MLKISCNTPYKDLREQAYETVLSTRGSWDVPGFDACVDAELNRLVGIWEKR